MLSRAVIDWRPSDLPLQGGASRIWSEAASTGAVPPATFRSPSYSLREESLVPSGTEPAADADRIAALVRSVRALVDRAVVDPGSLSGEVLWGASVVPDYPGISKVDPLDVRFASHGAGLAALRTACRRLDHLVAESVRSGELSDAAYAKTSVRFYEEDGRAVQVAILVGRSTPRRTVRTRPARDALAWLRRGASASNATAGVDPRRRRGTGLSVPQPDRPDPRRGNGLRRRGRRHVRRPSQGMRVHRRTSCSSRRACRPTAPSRPSND